jgi:hypothetical protein
MRKRTQKNRKRFSKKQRKLRLSKKQRKLRLSKKRGQKKMRGGAPPVAGEFCAFKADCGALKNTYNNFCSTSIEDTIEGPRPPPPHRPPPPKPSPDLDELTRYRFTADQED